jgi:hypothetical protein
MAGDGMRLILLTKYNAAIPGQEAGRGLDAGWLAARLALFEAWTAPAVRAQSRRPDAWLIFVDAETDAGSLKALEAGLVGLATLVPVRGQLTDARIAALVAEVVPGTGARAGALLSARLDSDDAIAANYLERLVVASTGWRGFVNAPLGYRVCGERVLGARERSGPFLAFVEDAGPQPLTVFQVPHSEAARRGPVRQLGGRPAWIQVVHGGNLANAFSGWPADGGMLVSDMGLEALRARRLDGRIEPRTLAKAVAVQMRHELVGHVRGIGWKLRRAGGAP